MEPVYHSVLDPMVALGYAAAATSRIRLGVAVVNMPYLSPAYLAKQAATVDVLSDGRLDLGLGLGWMAEEFAAAGATMARRGARTAEYIEVMRRLWAGGVAEFSGEFYTLPAGRMAPEPVQRPGPPILLGGTVPRARGTGRAARRRLGDLEPGRPVPDRRGHQGGPGRGRAGGPRPGGDADHLPGRGPLGRAGDRARRRGAAAAVGQLRRHPRRHPVAGRAGRHRDLLRPQLGSAGRVARRRPGRRRRPGHGDPGRAGPPRAAP